MMKRVRRPNLFGLVVVASLAELAACDESSPPRADAKQAADAGPGDAGPGDAGLRDVAGGKLFQTSAFTVKPGQERFLCYAQTLTEDLNIDRFSYETTPVVHHFVLVKATAPEPEGLSECNVLFRASWQPLFGAGTAGIELGLPEGAGQMLKAGDQIMIQLHLLNAGQEPVTTHAEVRLRTSKRDDLMPVGLYTIGNPDISLPPQKRSSVTAVCHVTEPVTIFAALPHMHYLGRRLTLEVGATTDTLKTVFDRDPYDFDDQRLEPFELELSPGEIARVTCDFENTRTVAVGFGESSKDEMCYFVGFGVGFQGFKPCTIEGQAAPTEVPRNPDAGTCGEQEPNALGVGASCTRGGGECPTPLSCTSDLSADAPADGWCMKLGCATDDDCGGGYGVCCTPTQGGGAVNICFHEACRELTCAPVE